MRNIRRIPGWTYLTGVFVVFWIIFAIILISSGFPFMVISMALTVVAALSFLVILLLHAYQKNW